MVIWLIGMSGAGKTTIGQELWRKIRKTDKKAVFLDGDILRDVWGETLGHSVEDRYKNAHRISNLCKLLDSQGLNVVACVLSIFPEWQKWNKKNYSSYFEIFVDTSFDVLEKIDDKGIYGKARRGELKNVVGIDIPFPRPEHSNVTINNSKRDRTPENIAIELLELIRTSESFDI